MRQRPEVVTTVPVPDADRADPLASLRALPDIPFAQPAGTTENTFPHGAGHLNAAPNRAPRVNTHVHLPPNFSAFRAVEQALELAADAELQVLGASNYYDFSVYRALQNRRVPKACSPSSAWRSSAWWQS